MSYRIEQNPQTGKPEYVIDTFQNGISSSPYMTAIMSPLGSAMSTGLSDMRNVNIISIPGEASVSFSTTQSSFATFSGSVASADSATNFVFYTGASGIPMAGMALVFAGGSLPGGVSAGTQSASTDANVYWIGNVDTGNGKFKLYTDFALSNVVTISSTGTGTFASIDISQPRQYTKDDSAPSTTIYYIADKVSRVWKLDGSNWRFTGNTTRANGSGNGLVYYRGYIFNMRNATLDYMKISTGVWSYGWNPPGVTTGNTITFYSNNTSISHYALVGQDDVVYVCDSNYIVSFFEKPNKTFDPTDGTTYTPAWNTNGYALKFPVGEVAQWLAELGTDLMIAGRRNLLYPWDRISTSFKFPIFLSEDFGYTSLANGFPTYPKLVTVNTNTFIFMGNRGRIYVTNGTNAQLWLKIPDHISGTVDPYYFWGGVGYNKNQLYFGVYATTNNLTAVNQYGGLWAVDLDTKALRLVNKLSYGTYGGACTVYIPVQTTGAGSSFYAGWDSDNSTYGVDSSSSVPYSNYESYIDSDMIPVGFALTAYTAAQFEFKLTTPLVANEGVKLAYRTNITGAFTTIGETLDVGAIDGYYIANFQKAKWIQLRVSIKSTSSSPSYTRLREIRFRQAT